MHDHALVQLPVRGGINHAEAVREDADRRAARVQRGGVCDRVDPAGHPAHDDDPHPREPLREKARRLGAVRGMVAAPHDPHGRLLELRGVAPDVEQHGRLGDLAQQRREGRVIRQQQRRAQPLEPLEDVVPRFRRACPNRRRGGTAHTGQRGDRAVGSVKRAGGALERGDERAQPPGADPR